MYFSCVLCAVCQIIKVNVVLSEKSTAVIIDERMDPNHPENREVKRGAFTTTTSPDAAVVENLDSPAEPSASGATTIPTTQQVQVPAFPQAAGPATSSDSNPGVGKFPDALIPPERTRPPPTRKGSVTLEMIPEFQGQDMDSGENIAVTGLFATSFDVQVPVAEQTGDKNGLLDHEEWIDTSVPPHILQQRRDLNEGGEEEDKGADERQWEGVVDTQTPRTESELGPSPMDVIYDSNAITEHETGAKLDYSSGSISFENPNDYSSPSQGNIGTMLSVESQLPKTDGATPEKLSASQDLTYVYQSSQDLTCVTQSAVSLHLRKVSSNGGVEATRGSEYSASSVALDFLPKMNDQKALQNMTVFKSESSSEDMIKENVQFSNEGQDNPSFIQSTDPAMAETCFSQEILHSGFGADVNKSAQLGPYVSEENLHNPPKPLSISGEDSDINHHTDLVTQFSDLGSPYDKRGDDSQNKNLPVFFVENVASLNRDNDQDCTPVNSSSLMNDGHQGSFHIELSPEVDTVDEKSPLERYKISSSEHFEQGASDSPPKIVGSFDLASHSTSVMSTPTSDSMQVKKVEGSEQFPVAEQPSTTCPDFSQA